MGHHSLGHQALRRDGDRQVGSHPFGNQGKLPEGDDAGDMSPPFTARFLGWKSNQRQPAALKGRPRRSPGTYSAVWQGRQWLHEWVWKGPPGGAIRGHTSHRANSSASSEPHQWPKATPFVPSKPLASVTVSAHSKPSASINTSAGRDDI